MRHGACVRVCLCVRTRARARGCVRTRARVRNKHLRRQFRDLLGNATRAVASAQKASQGTVLGLYHALIGQHRALLRIGQRRALLRIGQSRALLRIGQRRAHAPPCRAPLPPTL